MNHILITSDPLDASLAQRLATSPCCGAVSLFIGVTRDHFQGKGVVSLEYEAYQPMAEKELEALAAEIRNKWPGVKHVVLQHRLGLVPVTEASVIVCVSSPHRSESLSAVAFGIDTLKARVPIWKREIYDDGSKSWKENSECGWKQQSR